SSSMRDSRCSYAALLMSWKRCVPAKPSSPNCTDPVMIMMSSIPCREGQALAPQQGRQPLRGMPAPAGRLVFRVEFAREQFERFYIWVGWAFLEQQLAQVGVFVQRQAAVGQGAQQLQVKPLR